MNSDIQITFKETEVGLIPQGWEVGCVKNVAIINEKAIGKNYPYTEIEYIDVSSVDRGQIVDIQKLSLETAPSRAKRILKDNDIIISTVRPNLRHHAFIKKACDNLIASTGYAVITPKKINPNYLYYYLTTDEYTEYLSRIADSHTSTYPAINPDVIEDSFIAIPPEQEQNKIAEILASLDGKIELNRQINANLEKLASALFKHWFEDFEFPDKNGKPYRSSGGKMVDSELEEIPEGWRVGRFSDLADVTSGKRPGEKAETKSQDFSIPLLGASSVMGYVKKYLYNEPILVTGRVGTHGIIQRIDYPCWPSDNTLVIKTDYIGYTFQVMKSIDFLSLNRGSTQPLITQGDLNNIEVIIPVHSVLDKFKQIIEPLMKMVGSNEIQSDRLGQTRDFLLPRLMSGKIRVNQQ